MKRKLCEAFHKVQNPIPLMDVIKKMPWYAKILTEIFTKRKLKDNEEPSGRGCDYYAPKEILIDRARMCIVDC